MSDSELDDSWLEEIEKEEEEYDIFYKDITDIIRVTYIYINETKNIYHIKKEKIDLDDNKLNKKNLIFLLKKNKTHNNSMHKIISVLQYNIDLKADEVNLFLKNLNNFYFLNINEKINTIKWEDTINLFKDMNTLYIIYYKPHNKPKKTTKKIYIKQKLKRKKSRKSYLKTPPDTK